MKAIKEMLKDAPDWAQKYSGPAARSEYPPTPIDQEYILANPSGRNQNKFDSRFGRGAMGRSYAGYDQKGMDLGKNPDYDKIYQDSQRRSGKEEKPAATAAPADDAALLAYVQQKMGKGGWDDQVDVEAPKPVGETKATAAAPVEAPAKEKGVVDSVTDWVMDRIRKGM